MSRLVATLVTGVLLAPVVAQPSGRIVFEMGPPIVNPSVAVIVTSDFGRETLSARRFRQQLAYLLQQEPAVADRPVQVREKRRDLAEGFVLDHVMTEEARRDPTIHVNAAAVTASLDAIRLRSNLTERQLAEQMARDGLTMDSLRALLRAQMQQQVLTQRWGTATRDRLRELIRTRHVRVRVNPSVLQADLTDPLD